MLRRARLADLVAFFMGLIVSSAVAMGCGGQSSLTPTDSGAADSFPRDGTTGDGDSHDSAPQDVAPGALGLIAGNGTRIPDPPLEDPCTVLGVGGKSCASGDACPVITCECEGIPRPFLLGGSCTSTGRCLTAVSCPAVCAGAGAEYNQVFICLADPPCDGTADCSAANPECLHSLDGDGGHCVSGQVGSDCYRDADCASSACVAMTGGQRSCQDKQVGSSCNRDEQCDAPANGIGKSVCVLRPGEFQGVCGDSSETAPCLASSECLPGYGCAVLDPGELGQCTSRGAGAPCASDTDCAQGLCVSPNTPSPVWGKCGTGEIGATCTLGNDCHSGFCFQSKCTAGTTGSPCVLDTDCASHMCASAGPGAFMAGQCTDGQLGSPCWGNFSTQCLAGLHCTGDTPGSQTCTAP